MPQSAPSNTVPVDPAGALAAILTTGNDLEKCLAAQGLGQIGCGNASQALITALRDADEDVRIDAVNAVVALSIDEAIPTLVENITQDPSLDSKLACIEAAGHFRVRSAVDVLCKLVRGMASDEIAWDEEVIAQSECDEWPEVQLKAIQALGRIGDESAVDDICSAMKDEFGPELTRPGLTALSAMGSKGRDVVIAYLRSKDPRRRRIALAILAVAEKGTLLELAADLLADSDPQMRLGALNALPDTDSRIVDCLRDKDPSVRATAAARMARLQPSRLELFLNDNAEQVRIAVLATLTEASTTQSVASIKEKLLGWLEKGTPALLGAVCKALPIVSPDDAGAHVRRVALRRAAPVELRREAVASLARLKPDDIIETLVSIAREPLRPMRLSAIGAIASLATDGDGELAQRARAVLLEALAGDLIVPPERNTAEDEKTATPSSAAVSNTSAEKSGTEAPSPLTHGQHAAKEDDAQRVNRIRIDRDGNIIEHKPTAAPEQTSKSGLHSETLQQDNTEDGDPDAFPVSTLSALQDGLLGQTDVAQDSVDLTSEDLSFLELAQGRKGKKTLCPDQKSPAHTDVRVLAARLLVDLTGADVVDALVAVLSDKDEELRTAAAMSLASVLEVPSQLQETTATALASHLIDKNPVVRLWLTRAAGLAGSTILDALRDRLDDDEPGVRAEAIKGVARSDHTFDPVPYLNDQDMTVRRYAAQALVDQNNPNAHEHLLRMAFANDGADRFTAADLLRRCAPERASSELIKRLQSAADGFTRRISIEVLAGLNAVAPLSRSADT